MNSDIEKADKKENINNFFAKVRLYLNDGNTNAVTSEEQKRINDMLKVNEENGRDIVISFVEELAFNKNLKMSPDYQKLQWLYYALKLNLRFGVQYKQITIMNFQDKYCIYFGYNAYNELYKQRTGKIVDVEFFTLKEMDNYYKFYLKQENADPIIWQIPESLPLGCRDKNIICSKNIFAFRVNIYDAKTGKLEEYREFARSEIISDSFINNLNKEDSTRRKMWMIHTAPMVKKKVLIEFIKNQLKLDTTFQDMLNIEVRDLEQ